MISLFEIDIDNSVPNGIRILLDQEPTPEWQQEFRRQWKALPNYGQAPIDATIETPMDSKNGTNGVLTTSAIRLKCTPEEVTGATRDLEATLTKTNIKEAVRLSAKLAEETRIENERIAFEKQLRELNTKLFKG